MYAHAQTGMYPSKSHAPKHMASEGQETPSGGEVKPGSAPAIVQEAVLLKSGPMPPEFSTEVKGYEFERDGPVDYHALLQAYRTSGFQATNFGLAVEQITMMVNI